MNLRSEAPAWNRETAREGSSVGSRHSGYSLAFAGIFLFTVLLYARPGEAFPGAVGDFPIVKIVAIATLIVYILQTLTRAQRLTIFPLELKMLLVIAALGFLFIPIAQAPQDSWTVLLDLFIKVVIIFILMINVIDTRKRLESMMRLIVIAGTVLSIFAAFDYASGTFGTVDKSVGVRIAGVVGGIFSNPNDLATSFNLLIPLAVGLALLRQGRQRYFYFACAAILATGVVLTFSRGGFLGLVAVCAVLLWKLSRESKALSALALILTVFIFLSAMPVGYSGRIVSIFDHQSDPTGSSQARIDLLNRGLELALAHPVLGLGIGNFHIYSIQEQRAHNSYLEIAAELGMLGLIAYLIMILAPLRSLRRIEKETTSARYQETARGDPLLNTNSAALRRDYYFKTVAIQGALFAYLVCSFFGSIQYLWFLYYPLAFAIAFRRIYAAELAESTSAVESPSPIQVNQEPVGVLWAPNQRGAIETATPVK